MTKSWALLFLLLVPQAHATDDVSYDKIVALIQVGNITSLEGLLAKLPASYRQSYTLMYQSHSLQQGSYDNPRAIVFGSDGKTVISFNGDPSQRGFNELEVMQWSDKTQSFELHSIEFPRQNNGSVHFSETNPQKCLQCHASDPKPYGPVKPIWASYPSWRGAYGSCDDSFIKSGNCINDQAGIVSAAAMKKELDGFESYKKNAETNPRYKLLGTDAQNAYFPFHMDTEGKRTFSLGTSPNTRLVTLLHELNSRRIFQQIKSSPLYAQLKNTLAYASLCGLTLSDEQLKSVNKIIERWNGLTISASNTLPKPGDRTEGFAPLIQPDELLNSLGIVTKNSWDLHFTDDPKSFTFTGVPAIPGNQEIVGSLQYLDLKKSDLDLPGLSLLSTEDIYGGYQSEKSFGQETNIGTDFMKMTVSIVPVIDKYKLHSTGVCDYLKAKSAKEIKEDNNSPQEYCENLSTVDSRQSLFNWIRTNEEINSNIQKEKPIDKCIRCHVTFRVAPPIPFNDPKALKESFSKGWPTLELIKEVISNQEEDVGKGGHRMPFGQKPLSDQEQKELLDYLKNMTD